MWPEPTPYGFFEMLFVLVNVVVCAALVALPGARNVPLPKPRLTLRPWTRIGMFVFVSFTFCALGTWALLFALFGSKPLWGGALQFFLLGLVMLTGVYLAPVLFKSRFEV
ncbi:MAG: hypothetical protein JWN13_105 [Betaproteobacteria bacterium]|jgi:hypothetical protein|nr:hypothetical protein [Betaproteobacteria bacterium]